MYQTADLSFAHALSQLYKYFFSFPSQSQTILILIAGHSCICINHIPPLSWDSLEINSRREKIHLTGKQIISVYSYFPFRLDSQPTVA